MTINQALSRAGLAIAAALGGPALAQRGRGRGRRLYFIFF